MTIGIIMKKILVYKKEDLNLSHFDKNKIVLHRNLVAQIFNNLVSKDYYWMERDEVENNENYIQIIPYAIVQSKNKILMYKRSNPGEKRLQDMYSIGFGGHIEESTETGLIDRIINDTAKRELVEELGEDIEIFYEDNFLEYPKAYIYDNSTEVGRVHLGVVNLVEVVEDLKVNHEDKITDVRFVFDFDLNDANLETWSRICYDGIFYGRRM